MRAMTMKTCGAFMYDPVGKVLLDGPICERQKSQRDILTWYSCGRFTRTKIAITAGRPTSCTSVVTKFGSNGRIVSNKHATSTKSKRNTRISAGMHN